MNYSQILAETIVKSLDQKYPDHGLDATQVTGLIESPKNEKMGDLAFPCFILAKALKKAPPLIAKDLAEQMTLDMDPEVFSQVVATGPYLNFNFNSSALAENLIKGILSEASLNARADNGIKMMFEYSQPNTHKAFHVGHTRNVALGDCLVRLHKWAGFPVIAANYIGDVGTHIAKCLWYYLKYFDGETPTSNLGEFLGDFYVKANEKLDFKNITHVPVASAVTAQVKKIADHPEKDDLKVLTINTKHGEKTVVCGGTGYQESDLVAYIPVGAKYRGRDVQPEDKNGVESHGFLCSEKELTLSEDENKIFVFSDLSKTNIPKSELEAMQFVSTPPVGVSVAQLFTRPHVDLETEDVVTEMMTLEFEVQEVLQRFESKEPETYKLWEKTRKWSLDEFDEIYQWLGTKFDHVFYESDVGDEGKDIVKSAYEKGTLIKSEGAIGADLSEFNLPFFLLLKSNGTGMYSTKDLALAKLKFEKFKIQRNIYVVDVSQSLHFQQTFKTLELLGFEQAKQSVHFPYAMVERPDGKMSSRKGNVILFSQLKSQLMSKIKNDFLAKYLDEWSSEDIEDTAHKISVATIKYGMLNQDNNKKIIFDLDEWTARTGNTGPYLMYAYARTKSILRDAGQLNEGLRDYKLLQQESELKLLRSLEKFEATVLKSCENFEPQTLCIYLYGISKDFSGFYTQCSILKADTEELKQTRLALMLAFSKVLNKGLDILGITTAERM
ncbi:MAG: arginine--tRNA ligase [Bdellovibrionaceae bacterium]|jgi:arginyl-tRNA synthetase|nr:arginine--tRNA ligase [Pseudobdellovibrionaceae bacterium]